jgi:hypothetical protein
MLHCHRLPNAATLLSAAIVFIAVVLPHGDALATYFAPSFQVDAHTYRAICDQPKDVDHADLCQQWRMAEAAERQLWLTALGLAFISLTLFFTARAAIAASRAADAARQGNKISRNLFVAEQRPWVSIEINLSGALTFNSEEVLLPLKLKIENIGRSPAESVRRELHLMPNKEAAKVELQKISRDELAKQFTEDDPPGDLMFPGEQPEIEKKFRIRKDRLSGVTEISPAFIGCITYENGMGHRFQTILFTEIQRNIKHDPRRTFEINDSVHRDNLRFRGKFIRDGGITSALSEDEDANGED